MMSHDLLVQNGLLLIWFFVEESVAKVRIILRFWETAHLPLPLANTNTSHLGKNVGLGEG